MFETKPKKKKKKLTPAENIKGQWFRNTVQLGAVVTQCRQDQYSSSCTRLHLKQETAATLVSSNFSTPTLSPLCVLFSRYCYLFLFYLIFHYFLLIFLARSHHTSMQLRVDSRLSCGCLWASVIQLSSETRLWKGCTVRASVIHVFYNELGACIILTADKSITRVNQITREI